MRLVHKYSQNYESTYLVIDIQAGSTPIMDANVAFKAGQEKNVMLQSRVIQ